MPRSIERPIGTDNSSRLAHRAAVLGHPSRARMLLALMDGQALSVSQLATVAGIALPTASEHLSSLDGAGWIVRARAGRQRVYRIASLDAAQALEALGRLDVPTCASQSERTARLPPLHFARTCYDHLAGRVGVAITDALCARGWLQVIPDTDAFAPSEDGVRRFGALGIDIAQLRGQRRAFASACVDWTERRPHLAGALGAALCTLLERRWFARSLGTRALEVTPVGWRGLAQQFDLRRDHIDPNRSPQRA